MTAFLNDPLSPLEIKLEQAYRCDETHSINNHLESLSLSGDILEKIQNTAKELIGEVRSHHMRKDGFDALLYEYDLSSEEGITLMCLAEAFLRIPDNATLDELVKDKITGPDWHARLGQSDSMWVNAATFGLMITGKILSPAEKDANTLSNVLKKLLEKSSEPIIRKAIKQGMKILSQQFVMGRTIQEALTRADKNPLKMYRYSYDMLGESARTALDAERYYTAYHDAIVGIGRACTSTDPKINPGISVKLSALHPRYQLTQADRVLKELVPKVKALALLAKENHIGFTIDAEESERLSLSLAVIEAIFSDPDLNGWNGFGLAVQAYQKRATYVIDWLADLAQRVGRQIMVRLVKGAYWDTEIKRAQELGLENYAVYTRKCNTDISYLACAQKMVAAGDLFYSQFATHNAYTIAAILSMMGERRDFEFQCLHGMGHNLYDYIVAEDRYHLPCRVYAPVGSHEDLLPYLVRRLLENGANTSFVNRIIDANLPVELLLEHPMDKIKGLTNFTHPHIALPRHLYGDERLNASSIDLSNRLQLSHLLNALKQLEKTSWQAEPLPGISEKNNARAVMSPSQQQTIVGHVITATTSQMQMALTHADQAFDEWSKTAVTARADCLLRAALLLERDFVKFISLMIREAGKTLNDAIAEVREAIDFCRYYALEAKRLLATPTHLVGPTGELNQLTLHGRGTILCISPWNFPLAIFLGQVTASLVTGNTVIAKPAQQTTLVAYEAVRLLHEAGIPHNALQFLPCSGKLLGEMLLPDPRIKGVVFTGSTETAHQINQILAQRRSAITPLIAETGGQNAMIVDSSALPEQVVQDVITSAFGSAGQRCSALRVLFLQTEIADKIITMLVGAMAQLQMGNPTLLSTDIGAVIDHDARLALQKHIDHLTNEATFLGSVPLPESLQQQGSYLAPCAFEIKSLDQLTEEHFGPILHIVRYAKEDLDTIIKQINDTQYGLTLGIHTRIEHTVNYILERVHVGNTYVNRSTIGAVVGVQPFGGEGLSGTGPKAGGPHYLLRLCTERTLTINTTATGGNAALMSLQEEG